MFHTPSTQFEGHIVGGHCRIRLPLPRFASSIGSALWQGPLCTPKLSVSLGLFFHMLLTANAANCHRKPAAPPGASLPQGRTAKSFHCGGSILLPHFQQRNSFPPSSLQLELVLRHSQQPWGRYCPKPSFLPCSAVLEGWLVAQERHHNSQASLKII